MTPGDFDTWRADYDKMTVAQHKAWLSAIWTEYPVQEGWRLDEGGWSAFFDLVLEREDQVRVVEIGGWDGGLATWALDRYERVKWWTNIDLCWEALYSSPMLERYAVYCPDCFPWEMPALFLGEVYLASHTIEHMSFEHLTALLEKIPDSARYLAFTSPLPSNGVPDWTGYLGTHVLEASWPMVVGLASQHGWVLMPGLSSDTMRVWRAFDA